MCPIFKAEKWMRERWFGCQTCGGTLEIASPLAKKGPRAGHTFQSTRV
jgi:hypothetical protein